MTDLDQHLLGDSSRWLSASIVLGWGSNMHKLQAFLTSRTFAPHWREFELNYLMPIAANSTSPPPFNTIIALCKEAWESGRNDYYLMQPDISAWNKNSGLGHYVRLLTMLVRENMATNGMWPPAEGDLLQKHFESAYVIVNAMREEWIQKGKLYEHFKATNRGRYNEDLRRREQTMTVSTASTTASSSKATGIGESQKQKKMEPPTTNGHSITSNGVKATKDVTQAKSVTTPTQSSKSVPSTDKQTPIKQETLAEKETNFLDSLNAELMKKKVEVQKTIPSTTSDQAMPSPTAARKRANSDEYNAAHKRRRSDDLEDPRSGRSAEFRHHDIYRGSGISKPHGMNDGSYARGPLLSSSPTSRFPRPAEFGRPRYPDEPFAPRPPTVRYGTEQPRPMSHDVGAIVRIRDEHMSNGMSGNRYDMGSRELGHPRGIATGGGGPQSLKDTKPTSGAAANGPKERTPTEEVLLQTCAYELKGMMCPIKGGCRKKKICLAFSRGEGCPPSKKCRDAHVLRTCKYKAKYGYCSKEAGHYNAKCTFGHEPLRQKMHDFPGEFHE